MKLLRIAMWTVVFLLLGGAGAGTWAWQQARGFLAAAAAPGDEVLVTIPRGAGPKAVAHLLAEAGVVTDAERFALFLRWSKAAPKLRAGEFRLARGQTPPQVLAALLTAPEATWPVTFPEGWRYQEMASRAEEAGFGPASGYLALAEDPDFIASLRLPVPPPKTLEGLLAPDTFAFPRRATVEDVVRAQVARMDGWWTEERKAAARARKLSVYEVLVLASVVEKETGRGDERPLIAGVFSNRLRTGMPLQSDPTIIYGLKNYDGNIRRKDILEPHPWNTYVIPALPPTPIASPGLAAIDAVLHPATTDAVYFVARGDGSHHFSATLGEHNRMVDCYQRRRASSCR